MPKFPPPPRIPQNKSVFSVALAVSSLPSAVTMSADSRLSQENPYLRVNQPKPPPNVRPEIPVSETIPLIYRNRPAGAERSVLGQVEANQA
jgi:hypothetical protein